MLTNNMGKRQQWVARAVGVRAGTDIDIDTVVEMDEDNWLHEGFKETMMKNEENQAEEAEEEDIDGEEWILDREDWVKLGSGTTVLIAIILLVLIVRFCRRRSSPQEEETYVAYELNHLGKDYGEDRLQKDLDAIEDLSNQMTRLWRRWSEKMSTTVETSAGSVTEPRTMRPTLMEFTTNLCQGQAVRLPSMTACLVELAEVQVKHLRF